MPRNQCEEFSKGGKKRTLCWSIDKQQYRLNGWQLVGEPAPAPEPAPEKLPEIAVEVGVDAYDDESIAYNVQEERHPLEEMTKAELLDWALDQGHDLPNNDRKSEILAACKKILADS